MAHRNAPTIYFSGACSPALVEHRRRPDLGLLIQPGTARYAAVAPHFAGGFALDNGCFSSGATFNAARWCTWLERMPREGCHFAVAPDVVADARATWERSRPWLEPIRALGFPAALVFQDGIEATDIGWDAFDAAFIGGSTAFKLSSTAADLMGEARLRNKWVHVGRVNSSRRLRFAAQAGAHSVDGTYLAYGPRANLPRLLRWLDDLAC